MLFRPEHAVEHRGGHGQDQHADEPALQLVVALAIGRRGGDDQDEEHHVDEPVRRLRDHEVQGAEPRQLVEHERQDRHGGKQLGGAEADVHGARRPRVQQRAVGELVKQRRHGAEKRHRGKQLDHQRPAGDADPGRGVGAAAVRMGGDEEAPDDRRGAREHQELDRDAEAHRLAGLQEQQREEAGRVEHHPDEPGPDPRVALRRKNRQGAPVASGGGPLLGHLRLLPPPAVWPSIP